MVANRKETMYLRYAFSEDEKKEIALKMAQGQREKKTIEDDKKSVMSDFKSRLDLVEAQLNKYATNYDAGYEMRNVECSVTFNYSTNKKTWTRLDTGEIIREEDISIEERQTEFGK